MTTMTTTTTEKIEAGHPVNHFAPALEIFDRIRASDQKSRPEERDWDAKHMELRSRLKTSEYRGLVSRILDDHDTPRPILFKNEPSAWKFWVLSEGLARTAVPDEPYIHISITDSTHGNLEPSAANEDNLVAFIPLKFDDCEKPIRGFEPFNENQARALWGTVIEHKDRVKLIVVNCRAGLCRSSGVAAALAEHLNGHSRYGEAIEDMFAPNQLVWDMLRKTAPSSGN